MSLDSHLIHTCTIENPVSGGRNAYNNAVKTYGIPATGVRCRLVDTSERIWDDERQESVIHTVYKLIVLGNITINERAKVSLITLEDGTTINDTFVVTDLFVRRGRNPRHQVATLERVS